MVDTEQIFRYRLPSPEALLSHGFRLDDGAYSAQYPIMDAQFVMEIRVAGTNVSFRVLESDTGEEYILVHVPRADGGFVGEVRSACEAVLREISETCFVPEYLRAEQTKRTLAGIEREYGILPEFVFEKSPDCAVFRSKENTKWFGIIMTVERSKIGLNGGGTVEIMNLKGEPERIALQTDGKRYFPAYHMNKIHWYTICLDGRLRDEEVQDCIRQSYQLINKKAKSRGK